MGEWRKFTINEVCRAITDGSHFSPKEDPKGERIIATVKNMKEYSFDYESCKKISNEDYLVLQKNGCKVEIEDVLLSKDGTIGRVFLFLDNVEIAVLSSIAILKVKKDLISPLYLTYLLKSPNVQNDLQENFKTGSALPRITLKDIKQIEISIPGIEVQNKIASTLKCLDDKIDLLHRQNKTLEQLAETLFRQWFVEEAEDEWETIKLNDCFSVRGGTTPSTKTPEYWDGNINWTSPRDLSGNDFVYLFDTEKKITEKGLRVIGSGLLPKGTVLLSSRAPIGYLVITEIQVAINQGYIAIICDKIVSNYFIYLWLKKNMETIINAANGSVFLEISKSTFKDLDIVIPPKKKLQMFDSIIEPLFLKIKSNSIQIKTLETLRDALLSRLINGEIILSN